MAQFQTLPGFREFLPADLARRAYLFARWRRAARSCGFSEYDAPVLEPLELYKAKSGEEIEGQLFCFTDKGGREVSLRPEMTPSVARLVGERAASLKRPIKWFSIAEFYRYERQQKGRLRAFYQFNADIFGEAGPEAEIELISLLIECLAGLGLGASDFKVRLSDRDLWVHFLQGLGLDAQRIPAMLSAIDRHEKLGEAAFAPYAESFGPPPETLLARIREFLAVRSFEALRQALAGGGTAVEARLGDWERLLAGLAAMGLSDFVEVDLSVVRGLAYYTGFVFEAFDRKGDLRAIAGGGRYNDLVRKLGYAELPAAGFAIGDVTTGLLLENRGLMPPLVDAPDVFAVVGGPRERLSAFAAIRALRSSGFRVDYPLKDQGFGKQIKAAVESGARLALIFGGDECARGMVKLRDLAKRSESELPQDQVLEAVRQILSGDPA